MEFYSMGGLNGIMFGIMPIFVGVMFVIVIGILIVRAVNGAKQWKKNNDSPVLTVDATVVSKRTNVSHYHHSDANNMSHTTSSTTYFTTFQVTSGDRMEFMVHDSDYGMLVEQDSGKLTFQGTRFLGFERVMEQ